MRSVLFHALELFSTSLALHVIMWRSTAVRHQGVRLGLIFVVMPLLAFAAAVLLAIGGISVLQGIQWLSWVLAYLLHLSLAGSYLFLYTAVSGFSPSIAILERLEDAAPQGLKRHDLAPKWFTDTHLSGARRANLLATGFIVELNGNLKLTNRGRMIAQIFLTFRRFLGLPDIAKG